MTISKTTDSNNNDDNDDDATTPSGVAPISSATAALTNDDDGRHIIFDTKSTYSPIVVVVIFAIPCFMFALGIFNLVRDDSDNVVAGIDFTIAIVMAFAFPYLLPSSYLVYSTNEVVVRNMFGCSPFRFPHCISAEQVPPSRACTPMYKFSTAFTGLVTLRYRGCCQQVLLSPQDPAGFCAAVERTAAAQQQQDVV